MGNHDYLYRTEKKWKEAESPPPFEFQNGLILNCASDVQYRVLHGDEFDYIQVEPFYDWFCNSVKPGKRGGHGWIWEGLPDVIRRMLGDLKKPGDESKVLINKEERDILIKLYKLTGGESLSRAEHDKMMEMVRRWEELQVLPLGVITDSDELKSFIKMVYPPFLREQNMFELEPAGSGHVPMGKKLNKLKRAFCIPHPRSLIPRDRGFPGIVNRTIKYSRRNKCVLIFGHTHKPFILKDKGVTVANSGGWVELTEEEKRKEMSIAKGSGWEKLSEVEQEKKKAEHKRRIELDICTTNTFILIKEGKLTLNKFNQDGTVNEFPILKDSKR